MFEPDGTFVIPDSARGTHVVAHLDGFEPATVPRPEISRIVLLIARAVTTTVVVGSTMSPESPVAPVLGNQLTATDIARLPNRRLQARESLPLLPSVIRGPDGLMRMSGARPSESPMLLDGFDVTDPATGVTNISLAEAVQGVSPAGSDDDHLRQPDGRLQDETRSGDGRDRRGFVPPRFRVPGSTDRGIFRGSTSAAAAPAPGSIFTAVEYNFERITVPSTSRRAAALTPSRESGSVARFVDASSRHQLTIHGLIFER